MLTGQAAATRLARAAFLFAFFACAPSDAGDGAGAATTPTLDATTLEALARYDHPLADSVHACTPAQPAPASGDSPVVAAIRPGQRYRCELRPGDTFEVELKVDTSEVNSPVITGLVIVADESAVRELQAITAEPPPRGFGFLGTQDMDGDGLRELKLLSFWGATGNTGWNFWRRDTLAARFVTDPDLVAMTDPEPLRGAPCLRTWSGGGMAAHVYTAVVYCRDGGSWVERWHEHQEWDDANQFFLRSLQVRLPGQDSLTDLRTDTVRDSLWSDASRQRH